MCKAEFLLVLFCPNFSISTALTILMPSVFKGHLLEIFDIFSKFVDIISLKVHRALVLVNPSINRYHRHIIRSILVPKNIVVVIGCAAYNRRCPAIVVRNNGRSPTSTHIWWILVLPEFQLLSLFAEILKNRVLFLLLRAFSSNTKNIICFVDFITFFG